MKKLNYCMSMLIASAFLAGGLMGCSKSTTTPATTTEEGTPTTVMMSVVFTPEQTGSRATGDPNATDAEAAVKTVDIYIYSGAGAYLSHTHLAASDFTAITGTSTADAYETTTPIATTTGAKSFYVGVNLPTTAASSLENQSMSNASTLVQTIARADINTTNGLPMFSTAAVNATLVADASSNKITATVKRVVAKVTVESATNMVTEGASGTVGSLEWAINNQNSKYFLLQGAASAYADPNWTAASYLAGDFSAAASTDYVAVANGPQSPVSNYVACYALENTSNQKTTKELTRVTIRTTFIPTNIVTAYTSGSGTINETTNTATTPTTFYAVTPAVGEDTVYFQNQADANNYATDKGVTAETYTDGYCYWNIYLNKEGSGDVVRNDFYKCNITRIIVPGHPTDALVAPNSPPQADTSVTVDVDILFWNTPVMDNYDLVP